MLNCIYEFQSCTEQNILCIPVLLIFMIITVTFYITFSHVFHEYSHKLAIKLTSKRYNVNCNDPIEIEIYYRFLKPSFTVSNFYEALESNKQDLKTQKVIKINAISGYIGEIVFNIIGIIICSVLYYAELFRPLSYCFILCTTISILGLIIDIIKSYKSNKQNDIRNFINPKGFEYKYKGFKCS